MILAEYQVSIDTPGKIRLNDLPPKHICVTNDSAFDTEVPGGTLGDGWLHVSMVQAQVLVKHEPGCCREVVL